MGGFRGISVKTIVTDSLLRFTKSVVQYCSTDSVMAHINNKIYKYPPHAKPVRQVDMETKPVIQCRTDRVQQDNNLE